MGTPTGSSRNQPLPSSHPEFTITQGPGFHEFKVRADAKGNGSTIPWTLLILPVVLMLAWDQRARRPVIAVLTLLICAGLLHRQFTQVISESVIVLPPHGLQLETQKGFRGIRMSTASRFIPVSELHDFLINEGLMGWNVRYYLVALQRPAAGSTTRLHVPYEHLLPFFPVLRIVYRRVQDLLYEPQQLDSHHPHE